MKADSGLQSRRGGRAARKALREAPLPEDERVVRAGLEGGLFKPLSDLEVVRIHRAALDALEKIGLSQAIPSCVELFEAAGAKLGDDGRLRIPRALVEDTLGQRGAIPGTDVDTHFTLGR